MSMTKQEALQKIEELKQYVDEVDAKQKEEKVGIQIKSIVGEILFESTKTTYKEAVEEAVNNGADLSEAILSGADLYKAILSEADLSEADLSEADLSGADLSGADLSGADLYKAILSEADLSEADLSGADLSGADLSGADLYKAILSEAELQSVKFYGKGGEKKLKREQLPDFLAALGFVIED